MIIRPPEQDSPESLKLDEIRRKLVGFVPIAFRGSAVELLKEMDTVYFNWIDRLIEESRQHLIEEPEGEIIAVEDSDHSNVIHVNFGHQESVDREIFDIMEEAGAIFSEESEPEPPKGA